jgi:hypothetical protein
MRNQFCDLCFEAYHLVRNTGGFTINLAGPVTTGIAVAYGDSHERIVPVDQLTPKALEKLIYSNWKDALQHGFCVGGWVKDGRLHVELSQVFPNTVQGLKAAEIDAYENNQLAMYDLDNCQTLWL